MEIVAKKKKPTADSESSFRTNGRRGSSTGDIMNVDDSSHNTGPVVDNYMLRVNWFYRPKDISKKATDSRILFATMHSDILPLPSIRGKCTVKLKDHIEDLDKYRSTPNCFWFDKLYDRYIIRFYEVIPTEKITNIPKKMYDILTSRFKYAIVEIGRGKDLCAAPKSCEKCSQWCSPDDSVQCAHCKHYYHMLCVDPPIMRKPTRGFGWSCAKCSGALEKKLEENKGILTNRLSADSDMIIDNNTTTTGSTANAAAAQDGGVETDFQALAATTATATTATATRRSSSSPSSSRSPSTQPVSRYEELEAALSSSSSRQTLTQEQEHQLRMWPFRYLGVHAKMEDVLDTDDRIYPRAASRLGSRHQANISDWPGRPVVYYEAEKIEKNKKKYKGSRRRVETNDAIISGSATPSIDRDGTATPDSSGVLPSSVPASSIPKKDRPAWMQQRPAGYIERGGDATSSLMWKNPPSSSLDKVDESSLDKVDEFLKKTVPYAEKLSMAHHSANFVDACLQAYMDSSYDDTAALEIVSTFTRKSLKEPTFSPQEKKRFEDAVRKYGSELHPVYKEVKTKKSADVVRYYYLWKKTPSGHEIWDNYEGRKNNKKRQIAAQDDSGVIDEVADSSDDSAYENEKIKKHKRTLCCKFCQITYSKEWRRAPGYPVASVEDPIIALCIRCARLWRRYAVQWEDPEEVMRKLTQKGGNGWRRKVEEELVEDAKAIFNERDKEQERERTRKKIKIDKMQKEKGAAVAVAAVVAAKEKEKSKKVASASATPTPAITAASSIVSAVGSAISTPVSTPKTIKEERNGFVNPVISSLSDSSSKVAMSSNSNKSADNNSIGTNGSDSGNDRKDYSNRNSANGFDGNNSTAEGLETKEVKIKIKAKEEVESASGGQLARPCAVCGKLDNVVDQLFCQSCGLNVHSHCYGTEKGLPKAGWLCDPCSNDQRPFVNTAYGCLLCPVRDVMFYNFEAPDESGGTGGPVPDTVKRTFDNNWAHIRCSVFMPEVKFGNVKTFQPIEEIQKIPLERFKQICSLCGTINGACVSCAVCSDSFHIGCASKHNYSFGFDLQPVKSTRRGQVKTVKFGDKVGQMVAVIMCSKHSTQTAGLYSMDEVDPNSGKTALQIYCEVYKPTENLLTGSMRRAALYSTGAKPLQLTAGDINDSRNMISELSMSSPLELVLSPFRDLSDAHYLGLRCDNCKYSKAVYWMETVLSGSSDRSIECPSCYWKDKNHEAFKEAFPKENISVVDSETADRNVAIIQTVLLKQQIVDVDGRISAVANDKMDIDLPPSEPPSSETVRQRTALSSLLNPVEEEPIIHRQVLSTAECTSQTPDNQTSGIQESRVNVPLSNGQQNTE